MVDSLTSVSDGGNSGMVGIAAARGRGETSAEDEPAALAGVIPLQEESKRTTEVCTLAARTCATQRGCALATYSNAPGPDQPSPYRWSRVI